MLHASCSLACSELASHMKVHLSGDLGKKAEGSSSRQQKEKGDKEIAEGNSIEVEVAEIDAGHSVAFVGRLSSMSHYLAQTPVVVTFQV
jgi:hypothetical protein